MPCLYQDFRRSLVGLFQEATPLRLRLSSLGHQRIAEGVMTVNEKAVSLVKTPQQP